MESGHAKGGFRSIADMMKLDPLKPKEQALSNHIIKSFNRTHFQNLLMEWIVGNNLAFATVEHKELQAIFEYLNPSVRICGANLTADSIRSRVLSAFKEHKDKVVEVLQRSPGLVHLSFDGWRSGNRLALYGIACFYRDESNKPCKIAIGVPELSSRHSGANIAIQILDVIDQYAIRDKVGYFTLDNAENNDTAMDEIGKDLGFDGRMRRGRCFGHILNLSAKALLFGKNLGAFETELTGEALLAEAEYELWQKRGPVGKIHNIVAEIHRSDRLTYMLRGLQLDDINKALDPKVRARKPLSVVVDNDTRWLSQLYMIRRAIKLRPYLAMLRVKRRLEWEQKEKPKRLTGRNSANMPRICRPELDVTSHDWDALEHIVIILGHYENAVKTLEGDGIARKRKHGYTGSYGNIWDVIHGFEYLLGVLEHYKSVAEDFPEPEHFKVGINLAWEKLDKYYCKLDETPIYYAALALHPAYRWDWFTDHWAEHPEWVDKAKHMVQDVWGRSYANLAVVVNAENQEPVAKRRKQYHNAFEDHCFEARRKPTEQHRAIGPILDEYEAWQAQPEYGDEGVRDPLEYWHEKRLRYPRLSRMALDLLTVQAMSAECERMFSAAGRMVTPIRASLDAQIIGICQILRSWLRAGIVGNKGEIGLFSLVENIDPEGSALTAADDEARVVHHASSTWLLEKAAKHIDEENLWE
ncbi:hypothetical protein ACQRIT_002943 [Beauveria bassiana]